MRLIVGVWQFNRGARHALWREVAPDGGNPTGFDEFYTYDGLDRLERSARGTLADSDPNDSIEYDSITSPVKTQDFGLEALGNWKTFKEDDDATLDWDVLDQSRTHNAVNETTGVTGGSWIVPGVVVHRFWVSTLLGWMEGRKGSFHRAEVGELWRLTASKRWNEALWSSVREAKRRSFISRFWSVCAPRPQSGANVLTPKLVTPRVAGRRRASADGRCQR